MLKTFSLKLFGEVSNKLFKYKYLEIFYTCDYDNNRIQFYLFLFE